MCTSGKEVLGVRIVGVRLAGVPFGFAWPSAGFIRRSGRAGTTN